jgi:phosphoribosylglycinamide formyltransferase-1
VTLALFCSGGGSNAGAVLDAIADGSIAARAGLVVTDRDGIGALDRAREHGVPTAVLPPRASADAPAFADALLAVLREHAVDALVLAGYLKQIPAPVVAAFRHRILNVHPSLLPSFGGAGLYGRRVHEAVLAHGCRVSGATVHLVDEAYDTGPIVLQACVPVLPADTPASLAARVLAEEHRLLPEAVALLAAGRLRVDGRVVTVLPP